MTLVRISMTACIAALLGCDKASPPAPPPVPAAPRTADGPPLQLREEEGAFFWFNSREISDAGHSFYGPFAYSKLLPLLSPRHQKASGVWFVLCDGDFLPQGAVEIPCADAKEEAILRKVNEIGKSLCYIIAVYGRAAMSPSDIDRELASARVTGYLGKTSLPGVDRKKFLQLREQAALPIAARIDGGTFKRISFDWMTDQDLKGLGFESIATKD